MVDEARYVQGMAALVKATDRDEFYWMLLARRRDRPDPEPESAHAGTGQRMHARMMYVLVQSLLGVEGFR